MRQMLNASVSRGQCIAIMLKKTSFQRAHLKPSWFACVVYVQSLKNNDPVMLFMFYLGEQHRT